MFVVFKKTSPDIASTGSQSGGSMGQCVPGIKLPCLQLRPFAQNYLPNLVEDFTNFAEFGQRDINRMLKFQGRPIK
jgi:hypothetical protein